MSASGRAKTGSRRAPQQQTKHDGTGQQHDHRGPETRLFLAFLRADEATLSEYFNITAGGETAAWTLQLLPKTALMRQIFDRIDIRGGAYVEQVILEETQGDKSELRFHVEQ